MMRMMFGRRVGGSLAADECAVIVVSTATATLRNAHVKPRDRLSMSCHLSFEVLFARSIQPCCLGQIAE
jgi:hypothetical protein